MRTTRIVIRECRGLLIEVVRIERLDRAADGAVQFLSPRSQQAQVSDILYDSVFETVDWFR